MLITGHRILEARGSWKNRWLSQRLFSNQTYCVQGLESASRRQHSPRQSEHPKSSSSGVVHPGPRLGTSGGVE